MSNLWRNEPPNNTRLYVYTWRESQRWKSSCDQQQKKKKYTYRKYTGINYK